MQRRSLVFLLTLSALMIAEGFLTSCSNGPDNRTGTQTGVKTTPAITWTTPAAITSSTPLGGAQLNATANVTGAFAYTPAAGALLPVGTQTLSVTFTPANASVYNSATATVEIVVSPASGTGANSTPVITWATPMAITNPAPLSATELDATANVAGTFTYNPPAGTVLAPGTYSLSATFSPSDAAEYTTANATVSITVNAASTGTPEHMYFGGADIYVSGIAISNGRVMAVPGSPYTVLPQGEVGFAMTGAGNLIYTYNGNASGSPLTAWGVNEQTGALTQEFSGSEIVTSTDPTFTYAYGAGTLPGPSIGGYTINHTNGSLAQLSGSPYPLTTEIDNGVISSDGKWFCGGTFNGPGVPEMLICSPRNTSTAAVGPNEISDANYSDSTPIAKSYFVNLVTASSAGTGIAVVEPATSGIQSIGFTPMCAGCSPVSLAVSPAASLAAVGVQDSTGYAILLYRFDSSNGTLTQLSETPFNEFPVGLLFSCNGAYLAAVQNADNMASVFSVSGSNLEELSGSPISLNKATTGQGVVACP
jgi:hypothetical protein